MAQSSTIPNGDARPSPVVHIPAKSADYHTFFPDQPYTIGSLLPAEKFPQNAESPKLFEPITIRGVTFANRAWVSPMCMYSSDHGKATDWHLVHLGSQAVRGWGNITVEASAVLPHGGITPQDSGIWEDAQIPGFKRVVDFVHAVKGKIGIQLAHAGRKGSTMDPWTTRMAREAGHQGGVVVDEQLGGWPDQVWAPSAVSFTPGIYPDPQEMTTEQIKELVDAFVAAAKRAKQAGFDFVEIHGAHGYLLHEFSDPISNHRTDQYGGSLDNRLRVLLEIAEAVRKEWDGPLFYRVSASDWLESSLGPEKAANGEWKWWGLEQTTILTQKLRDIGVDLIDVSSGGNDARQDIKVGPSYQVPFAAHLKKTVPGILVGAVGIVTESTQANDILENGEADVVFCARQVLRQIDFPLQAALELGVATAPAVQYERAWSRMVVKRDHPKAAAHHKGIDEVEGEDGKEAQRKSTSAKVQLPEVHASIP